MIPKKQSRSTHMHTLKRRICPRPTKFIEWMNVREEEEREE
jgi:hypothetical protein